MYVQKKVSHGTVLLVITKGKLLELEPRARGKVLISINLSLAKEPELQRQRGQGGQWEQRSQPASPAAVDKFAGPR